LGRKFREPERDAFCITRPGKVKNDDIGDVSHVAVNFTPKLRAAVKLYKVILIRAVINRSPNFPVVKIA
jgi:hypothetical protein